MDASGRGRLLNRLADLMERDKEYLAVSLYHDILWLHVIKSRHYCKVASGINFCLLRQQIFP